MPEKSRKVRMTFTIDQENGAYLEEASFAQSTPSDRKSISALVNEILTEKRLAEQSPAQSKTIKKNVARADLAQLAA